MIIRFVVLVFALIVGVGDAAAQEAVSFKKFSSFRNLVPGIDFFASNRQLVKPFEKPTADTMARLQSLFSEELPRGAIFICSNLEQKDSVYEPKVLKSGYGWTLTIVTAEVMMQERMERMKSQMGGEIPAEILDRINNMPPEMKSMAENQMVDSTKQQIAHAVLWALLNPGSRFRSTRLDDMGKSPLPDWLDIGIASYASNASPNLTFLRENMDQTFPLEDIFLMSRPFVASSMGQSSGGSFGGGGMPRFGGSGGPSGGFSGGPPAGFGSRGSGGMGGMSGMSGMGGMSGGSSRGNRGGQRTMPKDEQDRLLFDTQSSTFFLFMIEQVGVETMQMLIQRVKEGEDGWKLITQPDFLGADLDKIDSDWAEWVQSVDMQKASNSRQNQSE